MAILIGQEDKPTKKVGSSKVNSSPKNSNEETTTCCKELNMTMAQRETRVITILRIAVLVVLVVTATLLAIGVYHYTRNDEIENFRAHYEDTALKVINSFHKLVEDNIEAVSTLSSTITSFAMATNATFPLVQLPDFEVLGNHLRVTSGSHIVHYMPVVTDETRSQWEEYALEHRHHIDESYESDKYYRSRQDTEFQISQESGRRSLQQQQQQQQQQQDDKLNMTILGDGSGYHPSIWRSGAVKAPGDEPEGGGPYSPLWQRSPVSKKKQAPLNQNLGNSRVLPDGLLHTILHEKKAVLNAASKPTPKIQERQAANLRISQYRQHVSEYVDGLSTFMVYPVFDSFDSDREVAGVLATSVYWKFLFSRLLPSSTRGIICVVESSSFNQTFSYRIDGQEATFIGMGDHHDPRYDPQEVSADVNEYLTSRASPQSRAYATVPISDKTQYKLRVFPSQETEDPFLSDQPVFFTVMIVAVFSFTSLLLMAFSYTVEKRQHVMMEKVVENSQKAARAERELNEFLSHEVRNPLAAAMSACSFVSTAVNEPQPLADEETINTVRDDVEVVSASLAYINDFLRSMLDIHQVTGKKIKLQMAPTDLRHDVLEPISSILHKRTASFDVLVECPKNLVVMTDVIRLKQVVLNLVRNASKFVERGFLRMRANVVEGHACIYVEDSGPGIPLEKKKEIFAKYQASLDLLGQGTGIGLSLSKKLIDAMGGSIGLDSTYDSGVDGCPGACFVIQLNQRPMDLSMALFTHSDNNFTTRSDHSVPPLDVVPEQLEYDEEIGAVAASGAMRLSDGEEGSSSFPQQPLVVPVATGNSCINNPPPAVPVQEQAVILPKSAPAPPAEEQKESSPPTLALPSKAPSGGVPAAPSLPASALPSELSVLFVDDDAVLRKLFARAVRRAMPMWDISEASSGETALRMCEAQLPGQYDLIFLDQYMASVDKQLLGTETAIAMRSKGISSKICGLSANDLRDAFIKAGADDFILKPMPCKINELKQVLERVLFEA